MHTGCTVPPRALHWRASTAVGRGSGTAGAGSGGGGVDAEGTDDPLGEESGVDATGGDTSGDDTSVDDASGGDALDAGTAFRAGACRTVAGAFGWEPQPTKTSTATKPSPRMAAY
jgi:hypothetical protein